MASRSSNIVQIKDLCNHGSTATLIARVKVVQGTAFKKRHRLSFYIFDDPDHVALVHVWTQNPHKFPKVNQGDLIKISNARIEIQPTPTLHVNIPGSTVEKISQSQYDVPSIEKTIKDVGELSGELSYGRHLIIYGTLESEIEKRSKTTNEPFLKMTLQGSNKIKREIMLWNSTLQEECIPGSRLTLYGVGVEYNSVAALIQGDRRTSIHGDEYTKINIENNDSWPTEEEMLDKINDHESESVEFKESLVVDIKNKIKGDTSKTIASKIAETIVGFYNTVEIGYVFLGINDNGEIIGLEKDFEFIRQKIISRDANEHPTINKLKDSFKVQLQSMLSSHIHKSHACLLKQRFYTIKNKDICVLMTINKNKHACFFKQNKSNVPENTKFYVREGASNKQHNILEAIKFIKTRGLIVE